MDASFRDMQLWNPWGSVALCAGALWSAGMKSWFQMGIRVERGEGLRQGDFVIHVNGLWRLRACLLDTMSSSWHRDFFLGGGWGQKKDGSTAEGGKSKDSWHVLKCVFPGIKETLALFWRNVSIAIHFELNSLTPHLLWPMCFICCYHCNHDTSMRQKEFNIFYSHSSHSRMLFLLGWTHISF